MNDAALQRRCCRLRAVTDTQFCQDIIYVRLHSCFADSQVRVNYGPHDRVRHTSVEPPIPDEVERDQVLLFGAKS